MYLDNLTYEWYAIYTKVNQEKKIRLMLIEQKIECYLPLTKTLRQWSDRKKWIEEPLFRCYLFVKVSYKEFFKVLDIPGVIVYVNFGGKPQKVPEYQLENIRTFVKQEQKEITLTQNMISEGIQAEVCYGPLKGVQGELIEICGQSRILIRIETMRCCLHANISKDEIRIIHPASRQQKGSIKRRKLATNSL